MVEAMSLTVTFRALHGKESVSETMFETNPGWFHPKCP
jgi:hypothetical protein